MAGRRFALAACALAALLVWAPTIALAAEASPVNSSAGEGQPTSRELVERPKEWDGAEIAFTGEAITETLERGEYAWIHLNDDDYALRSAEQGVELAGRNSGMAVWLPTELTEKIEFYGDHSSKGDVATVNGTFNAACPQHGGDMDIHATTLEVRTRGRVVYDPVRPLKALLAVLLGGVAAVLWAANRRAENRERKGLLGLR